MSNYWIIINLKAHDTHPVSHSDTITMKSYFDEDLADKSDEIKQGSDYSVPAEHSTILPNTKNVRAYHKIAEEEFLAPKYRYYVWTEPYASAAFAHENIFGGLAIGRVPLEPKDQKYKGVASKLSTLPVGISADDKIIEYDLKIGNSVAQYIAEEMSNNQTYHKLSAVDDHMKDANRFQGLHDAGLDSGITNRRTGIKYTYADMAEDQRKAAFYDYGHIVHADPHPAHNQFQALSQKAQEAYFNGGGEWDHKPRIYAVWGATNRLGNSGNWYAHDLWSNIHYGFIGRRAGFSLKRLISGAAIAQILDNLTGSDDLVDQQCTEAGYNLYAKKKIISYRDIIDIVIRHPNWDQSIRERPAANPPSVLNEIKKELNN